MREFIGKDFLLRSDTAYKLYYDYAASMPIIDYHCHINPREIFEDRSFENITQMWLEGDHYKWRIMRSNGVDEHYITGNAPDKEKFIKFAGALERSIGNPMYHWCHLELKNYFDYTGALNADTAEAVYDHCSAKLREGKLSVRGLIKRSNVRFIGTTDDPTDSLEWHEKIKAEGIDGLTVAPSFRPDKIINIDKPIWRESIQKLEDVTGITLDSVEAIKKALGKRMEHFASLGCKASDHGMDYVCCRLAEPEFVDAIYQKALGGAELTVEEIEVFKTALLLFAAGEYARLGWVMQLHYNCLRNPNSMMFGKLGPDTGFDAINTVNCTSYLASLLDRIFIMDALPRTVIYSLNPADNASIDAIIGAFQGTGVRGKIQHGSAWWFNDTMTGMREHMTSLANLSILGNFIGMLTDSRSFLSYARHEYFRRILCELVGGWIDNGELPSDIERAGKLIQDICYNNARDYFGLK